MIRLTSRPPYRFLSALTLSCTLLLGGCGAPEQSQNTERSAIAAQERGVEFTNGPDTLYGTFAVPDSAEGPVPAVLIISGSGPTDRDGNSPARPQAGTNYNFARVLADAGFASLRYDKLGSGETGLGSHDEDDPIDFASFAAQVSAAYTTLAKQPEVDPSKLMVLGHSEGALFALQMAQDMAQSTHEYAPAGLILAAPLSTRYLDLLDRQITAMVRKAEISGELDAEGATRQLSDLRYAITELRESGTVPDDLNGIVSRLFSPANAPFLAEADTYDPAELANGLSPGLPVLVLRGTRDSQVTDEGVDHLMTGLADHNAKRVDIAGADHIFRRYDESPGAAVLDENRPFHPDVAPVITDFVTGAV